MSAGSSLDSARDRRPGVAWQLYGLLDAAVQSRMGPLLLCLVPVFWVILFNVGPILLMLWVSFRSDYPLPPGAESHFTFDNYALLLESKVYYFPLLRSIVFAVCTTVATLVIIFPIAYFIARCPLPSRQFRFLILILVPFWAGDLVRSFSILVFLGNRGAVNGALQLLGIIDEPIPMLYTPFSLSVGILYFSILYMLFPLYAAIEKIPASLFQAGADLGAGAIRRFWHITLPLARDGIVAGSVLVFLHSMGTYVIPLLLGGSGTILFAQTIGDFFYAANADWVSGAAFSIVLLIVSLVPVGAVLLIFQGRVAWRKP